MSVETHDRTETITQLLSRFLTYARVELSFASQSLDAYRLCIRGISRALGDPPVHAITLSQVRELKVAYLARGLAPATQSQRLLALKRFLIFCRDEEKISVMDPALIRVPKRARRDVLYLTPDEVERLYRCHPAADAARLLKAHGD